MFESDIQHRQSLGSCFAGRLALAAAYERVRIGAAGPKWKQNGNIAGLSDLATSVSA